MTLSVSFQHSTSWVHDPSLQLSFVVSLPLPLTPWSPSAQCQMNLITDDNGVMIVATQWASAEKVNLSADYSKSLIFVSRLPLLACHHQQQACWVQ